METPIEQLLHPDSNKLIKDKDGSFIASIVDVELDKIECEFHDDDCVKIDTNDYTYITLTRGNLYTLLEMIDDADSQLVME